MPYNVPSEPLWAIFTPDALRQLSLIGNPSNELTLRLQVLAAGGLNSHNQRGQALRAYKAAWEVYLFAAFACGLFDGLHGADLRSRLTGTDDDNFRSAMSECIAAWYLAGKRKLPIEPRPQGRPGHPLEFVVGLADGGINVEVKAPYRPITSNFWWGDDADALQSVLHSANKQFAAGQRNLLIVVPRLRADVFGSFRVPIERAFIGETVIQIPIDKRTGGPAGPTTFPFKPSGDFAKKWRSGAPDSPQHTPRHTRVGAALFLGEYVDGREVKHNALVVRNPNAAVPLPNNLWQGIPEFSCEQGQWRWSDHAEQERLNDDLSSLSELTQLIGPDSEWLTNPAKFDEVVRDCLRESETR
jgi:hypothetical protein